MESRSSISASGGLVFSYSLILEFSCASSQPDKDVYRSMRFEHFVASAVHNNQRINISYLSFRLGFGALAGLVAFVCVGFFEFMSYMNAGNA